LVTEMDRRNKDRHNLQLVCLAKAGTAHSTSHEVVTENMSRDGILMRWLDSVPVPELGSLLNVEVALPASDFGPRVMRCATTVVRITRRKDGNQSVGLRIESVSFRRATRTSGTAKSQKVMSLKDMAPISDRVS
jgi:hypothetical protein